MTAISDDELGERLRAMFAAEDPVPPAAIEAARAAFGWRDIDAELAALVSDSLIVSAANVRGTPPRLLSFATDSVTIELEVTAEEGTARILGQLAPAQQADVVVEYIGGQRAAEVDPMGRFTVVDLPVDWLRVVVTAGPDRTRSCTEWFKP
jgi:hypothetical protein